MYSSSNRCKLNSITYYIQKNLLQTKLICNDILVNNILHLYQKFLLFCMYTLQYNRFRSSRTSGRCTLVFSILTLPLSILLISSTSLIRLRRCLPDVLIFQDNLLLISRSSRCSAASDVNPIIAFIGVRISMRHIV